MVHSRWDPGRVSCGHALKAELIQFSRPLHSGDIINIDLTLFHDTFHGDTSATFLLPDVDKSGRDLVDATFEALELGIRACGPGKELRGIGQVIE